jgi:hypothetical protein
MNDVSLLRNSLPEFLLREALTPVSFDVPTDLTPEQWEQLGGAFGRMGGSMAWWVGDWWRGGTHAYGDRKALVESEDWTGPGFGACANAARVCEAFKTTSRRREVLTFNHHAEVARLPPKDADRLLDWCEETIVQTGKPRTIRELREEVRRLKNDAIAVHHWTSSQTERKERAERGEAVVANMHEGEDTALLAWAEETGRLVRIDRQSAFGNPFVMPDDGDRGEVVAKFEKFYWPHKTALLERVPDLTGKVLACWCYPQPCHGDCIAETINRVAAGDGTAEEIAEGIADHDG